MFGTGILGGGGGGDGEGEGGGGIGGGGIGGIGGAGGFGNYLSAAFEAEDEAVVVTLVLAALASGSIPDGLSSPSSTGPGDGTAGSQTFAAVTDTQSDDPNA